MTHLIARSLKAGLGLEAAVRAALLEIQGSYAIAVICENDPTTLVAARSGCPLVIGMCDDGAFVASDVTAMLGISAMCSSSKTARWPCCRSTALLVKDATGRTVNRRPTRITWDATAAEKGGYPHFMLKEIHEQPQTILDTMRGRYSYEQGRLICPISG